MPSSKCNAHIDVTLSCPISDVFKCVVIMNNLLPKETVSNYEFRHRRHNLELINKSTHLADSDFIIRMLYKDMY